MHPYTLTEHAKRRIRSRNLSPSAIYAALYRSQPRLMAGGLLAYEHSSRRATVRVIVEPEQRRIVTAYRVQKWTGKRRRR